MWRLLCFHAKYVHISGEAWQNVDTTVNCTTVCHNMSGSADGSLGEEGSQTHFKWTSSFSSYSFEFK